MIKTTLTVLLAIIFCSQIAVAQNRKTSIWNKISLPFFTSNYDENAPLTMGIQYTYSSSTYRVTLKNDWQSKSLYYGEDNINNVDEIKGIKSNLGSALSVGIPIDARINSNLSVSVSPSFTFFNTTRLVYEGENAETTKNGFASYYINPNGGNFNSFDFPLSLKFKSDEKFIKNSQNRYKAYLLAGVNINRYISINKEYDKIKNEARIPDPIILKPSNLSWEAGVGVDIFFNYFTCSPELKFNQSFGSILDHDHLLSQGNQAMNTLDKAYLRNIKFSLIFK